MQTKQRGLSKTLFNPTFLARFSLFPALNHLQFVDGEKQQNPKYNTKYFDAGWPYADTIKAFEADKPYIQPVCFRDVISIQCAVSSNSAQPPKFFLLDCKNNVVDEVIPFYQVNTPENGYYDTSFPDIINGVTYNRYINQVNIGIKKFFTSTTNREGNYRFKVTFFYNDDDNKDMYSEWFHLKDEHPGTVLIQYNNTVNDFDTNFEQVKPRFALRVKGDIHSYEPGSVVTGYADQQENFKQLSSHPYDTFRFSAIDVPDYILKKLNHIFSCDTLRIDGKLFSRDDGAKWEVQREDTYPLKGITVVLRAGNNTHALKTVDSRLYFEEAAAGPKFYHNVYLTNGPEQILLAYNKVIEDSTDGEAWADDLNDNLAVYGLNGLFGYEDDKLYYDPADGETYSATAVVYSTVLTFFITTGSDTKTMDIFHAGEDFGVDWNDTHIEYIHWGGGANQRNGHTYSSNDDFEVRVFHKGDSSIMTYLAYLLRQPAVSTRVTNITGLAPSKLQQFIISQGILDSSFDLSFLQKTSDTLRHLMVSNCQMEHPFTGSLFANYGTIPKWKWLKSVNFTNNKINQTGVDVVLNEFANNAYIGFVSGAGLGDFRIQGQSPTAAPTGASLAARNSLTITHSWSLTTD